MKTKTLQMTSGLLMVIFWLATITLNAQITFKGYYADHEGGIGWDADGTGTEPAGDGHNNQYYYGASPDYDGIDPNPNAALGHFLEITDGFTEFLKVLEENDVDLNDIKLRYTLSSLGNDEEGIDWVTIGSDEYINYYGSVLKIYVQNELMISMQIPYLNFKYSSGSGWYVETPFMIPKNASMWSDSVAKKLASAFMNDIDGHSLQMTCNPVYSGHDITTDGRDGAWYNVINGLLIKGCPEIPFKGLNADHEGFVGWDADGTGPEPEGNGHQTQLYYGASMDYDDIDANPNAALGHCLEGAFGFKNLLIQLEYRGYDISDIQLKMGLISLGNDEMGIDWGGNWCNYYNDVTTIVFNNEPILHTMSDTLLLHSLSTKWTSESTLSPIKNLYETASENAQIIANALLLDLGQHHLAANTTDIRGGTYTFSGNGRNGAYYQIYEGKIMGMCNQHTYIEGGNLVGTLKAEKSPYLVNGNIEVPAGQTLNIEKGTKIAFRGPYRIYVKGSVVAEGIQDEPITFSHSNPNVLWDGFDYDSTAALSDTSFFKHCIFEYGYGFGEGRANSGGIFALAFFDKLVVENSIFRNNRVNKAGTYPPSGGAVALWESSPMFVNCTFHNNQAKYGGAMMVFLNSNPVISNCLFYENSAEQDGGAIEFYTGSNAILINNTFAENQAKKGGAIDVFDNSFPKIINSIFWGNRADNDGNQVYLSSVNNPDFYYCLVQGGKEEFGGYTFGGEYVECIDEDPLFIDDEAFPIYYPGDGPCYNAGTPEDSEWFLEEFIPELDLFGYPRILEGGIDIGAYESLIATVPEATINNAAGLIIYPNPFHHSTNIEFTLEKSSWVQIDVYNVIGKKVDVITQSELPAGKHTLNWQAAGLANGIYFIKLQAGNTITTSKLLKN